MVRTQHLHGVLAVSALGLRHCRYRARSLDCLDQGSRFALLGNVLHGPPLACNVGGGCPFHDVPYLVFFGVSCAPTATVPSTQTMLAHSLPFEFGPFCPFCRSWLAPLLSATRRPLPSSSVFLFFSSPLPSLSFFFLMHLLSPLRRQAYSLGAPRTPYSQLCPCR